MHEKRHQLVLVRHGETEWSKSGQHTSHTDLELTDHGREQARLLAAPLRHHHFALVLTSPLRRARETARIAGYGNAETTDDLLEWNYGEYEGITTPQIRERVPGWTIWDYGAPGGETAEQVGARCDHVVARARVAVGDTLVFAHGHVLRVLAARWLGLTPRDGRVFKLDSATLNVLGWEHEWPAIVLWNDGTHPTH